MRRLSRGDLAYPTSGRWQTFLHRPNSPKIYKFFLLFFVIVAILSPKPSFVRVLGFYHVFIKNYNSSISNKLIFFFFLNFNSHKLCSHTDAFVRTIIECTVIRKNFKKVYIHTYICMYICMKIKAYARKLFESKFKKGFYFCSSA